MSYTLTYPVPNQPQDRIDDAWFETNQAWYLERLFDFERDSVAAVEDHMNKFDWREDG